MATTRKSFDYFIFDSDVPFNERSHNWRLLTLTASLLFAGYPKAITANTIVVNRHDSSFNPVNFIFEIGSLLRKVSSRSNTRRYILPNFSQFFSSANSFLSLFFVGDYNWIASQIHLAPHTSFPMIKACELIQIAYIEMPVFSRNCIRWFFYLNFINVNDRWSVLMQESMNYVWTV